MSWRQWAEALRQEPRQAVTDLLRGAADVAPYERAAPHEFLLAVLPRSSRLVRERLLGEPAGTAQETGLDLPACLDAGLADWLRTQRQAPLPKGRKLGAHAAQVCEALQWPLYFDLPQSRAALREDRALWLQWTARLNLSAYRDPEYDYWQVLASRQDDDELQFHWQSFVAEAGRTRSLRYLNLGLLALARLPLSAEDSLRNLRLQVQALVDRYARRKSWGTAALEELADNLSSVRARNPSLSAADYRIFMREMLTPLGEDKVASVLGILGLATVGRGVAGANTAGMYKLEPPGLADATREAVQAVRCAGSLAAAWKAIHRLLAAHEDYLHKTGDAYNFVRALDECARALCKKFSLHDPEIQARLFHWIHLALRLEPDEPRRWMLWELALRKVDQPQRAQWVLWEMTRRFPDNLHCRLDLARLLAASSDDADQAQAQRLLQQVLQLDPENLHAHSTLAQLAIRRRAWPLALAHAQAGLRIQPNDGVSVVLLATAYARRNEGDDLQAAIDHLQRFVGRYPGNVKAEGYLGVLLKRQQLAEQGRPANLEDEESVSDTPATTATETDAAWRAFAASIQAWSTPSTSETIPDDRLLPLPVALGLAVAQDRWEAAVLDAYDAAAQREFPLETRLWRYLFALHTDTPVVERERARQTVNAWIDSEIRTPSQGSSSWPPYLKQHRAALDAANGEAWAGGKEWLQDLLKRHQPLPAPLYA
ncbi:MAG: hypothetical protein RBT86_03340 [Azospira sp.]|jgi:cytochrome c-type biogenesis protein CcmH/NrfG|nr:hypothetical protein [Azospira sp.]